MTGVIAALLSPGGGVGPPPVLRKAQVNLAAGNTFSNPFLNLCKACGGRGWEPSDLTSNWATLFDPRNYPTAMPSSGTWQAFPFIYGQVGDTWVLDWPGTANFTISSSLFSTVTSGSGRIECPITSANTNNFPDGTPNPAFQVTITLNSMAANAFAGGSIRLYLKDGSPSCLGTGYGTRLNNGEVFDPRWTLRYGSFGVIRFRDWSGGQGKWVDRPPIDSFSYYSSGQILSVYWCGASTGTSVQVVGQPPSAIASWTQGQTVQWQMTSVPAFASPSAVISGSLTTFTSVAHGLSNGDQIQFPANGADPIWQKMTTATGWNSFIFWTVTVIDADHFTVPFNSTGAGTYPNNGSSNLPYTKIVTLKVGTLAAVPCVQLAYAGNFGPSGWNVGQSPLQAGDFINGIYDATLGCVLCDRGNAPLARGVPIELIVQFCNANGVHPYLHLPVFADDDYYTQAATYLKNNLATNLVPRNELANEVWNPVYTIIGYFNALAWKLFAADSQHVGYGMRVAQIADLFKAVYGGSGFYNILMPVQSGFVASYQFNPFIQNRMINVPYAGKTVTITLANPAVFSTISPHGYSANDMILLTTSGALPSPLLDSVNASSASPYFILSSGLTATQFQLSATRGGSPISTLGASQSGTQTAVNPPIGKCGAIVHAPYYDSPFVQGRANAASYPNGKSAGGWADQVDNYNQGGAARTTAFNWVHDQFINVSQDPTHFPDDVPISFMPNYIAFWKGIANEFSCDLHEYEGGISIFDSTTGFPTTAPTSGRTVTVANVRALWLDFLASSQFADLTTLSKNASANGGTLFPSQYTADGPQVADQGYWPIYRLNTTHNGFVDSQPTAAYTALRTFNGQ